MFGDYSALRTQRGECSCRAAKLQHEAAILHFAKTVAMADQGVQPSGEFYSQRGGNRMLHPGASDDGGEAMLVSHFGEPGTQIVQITRNQRERFAQLQD